jgi:hypothetical protein
MYFAAAENKESSCSWWYQQKLCKQTSSVMVRDKSNGVHGIHGVQSPPAQDHPISC